MHDPFLENTTLQYRLRAAQAEVASFKSGKKYLDMQEMHRKEVRSLERRIQQLEEELAQAYKDMKANRERWFEAAEDMEKEYLKKIAALVKQLGQMEERALRAEGQRDEAKDKVTQQRHKIYELETALEEEKGKNSRLKAQLGHDHENLSIPSSKTIRRKKITNSREKTGKKPGDSRGIKGTAAKNRSRRYRLSSWRRRRKCWRIRTSKKHRRPW